MDVSVSASMHPALLEREAMLSPARVLRVLKPYVLRPLGLNLPPLFEGSAHLAAIPGADLTCACSSFQSDLTERLGHLYCSAHDQHQALEWWRAEPDVLCLLCSVCHPDTPETMISLITSLWCPSMPSLDLTRM